MGERFTPEGAANWKAPSEKKGVLDKIRDKVAGTVNESRIPNNEYESTVGVYGGKLKTEEDGKYVFDMGGIISKIDQFGDAVLRSFDEHIAREPLKMILRHPKWLFKFLRPGTKRYRGSPEEIAKNIEELGLGEYYGLHENGIEIKNPDIFKKGIALQDIFRSDQLNSEKLNGIDRFQALSEAGKYVSKLHERHAIGEVLSNDIIFQKFEDGKIEEPVLNIPDLIYNEQKATSEKDKRATDLLDFLMNVAVEEMRRSEDVESVKRAVKAVADNYADKSVVSLVASFINRGRLTLQGDQEVINLPNTFTSKIRGLFTKHNEARINPKRGMEGTLKELVRDVCLEVSQTESKEVTA